MGRKPPWNPVDVWLGLAGLSLVVLALPLVIYQTNIYGPEPHIFIRAMGTVGVAPGLMLHVLLRSGLTSGAALVLLSCARALLLVRARAVAPGAAPGLSIDSESILSSPILLVGLVWSQEVVALDSAGETFGQGFFFGPPSRMGIFPGLCLAAVAVAFLAYLGRSTVEGDVPASASGLIDRPEPGRLHRILRWAAAAACAAAGFAALRQFSADLRMDIHIEIPSDLYRPAVWWTASLVLAVLGSRAASSPDRGDLPLLAVPVALGFPFLLLQLQITPGLWWSPPWTYDNVPEYFVHSSGRIWNLAEYGIAAGLWFGAAFFVWTRLRPRAESPPSNPASGFVRRSALGLAKVLSWMALVPMALLTAGTVVTAGWLAVQASVPPEIGHPLARLSFRFLGCAEGVMLAVQLFTATQGWAYATGALKRGNLTQELRVSLASSCLLALCIGARILLWAGASPWPPLFR